MAPPCPSQTNHPDAPDLIWALKQPGFETPKPLWGVQWRVWVFYWKPQKCLGRNKSGDLDRKVKGDKEPIAAGCLRQSELPGTKSPLHSTLTSPHSPTPDIRTPACQSKENLPACRSPVLSCGFLLATQPSSWLWFPFGHTFNVRPQKRVQPRVKTKLGCFLLPY